MTKSGASAGPTGSSFDRDGVEKRLSPVAAQKIASEQRGRVEFNRPDFSMTSATTRDDTAMRSGQPPWT